MGIGSSVVCQIFFTYIGGKNNRFAGKQIQGINKSHNILILVLIGAGQLAIFQNYFQLS